MGDRTWCIVKFPDDNDAVEAVPCIWLNGNKCSWPPYPPRKLAEAIEKYQQPDQNWQQFNIIPFRNNVFDDYNVAKRKARKALLTSDLDSECQQSEPQKRKIKFKKTYSLSSVEDDSISLPPPPSIPKSFKSVNTVRIVNIDRSDKTSDTWTQLFPENVFDDFEQTFIDDSLQQNKTNSCAKEDAVLESSAECSKLNASSLEKVYKKTSSVSKSTNGPNSVQFTQEDYSFDEPPDDSVPHKKKKNVHKQYTATTSKSANVQEVVELVDIHSLLVKLVKKHELLHLLVSDLRENLDKLEKRLNVKNVEVEVSSAESIRTKFALPIDSHESLTEFNAYLDSNQNALKKAVHEVSLLGGKHLYDFVFRAGKDLITNGFASEFSYFGKRNKDAFQKLPLNKLIIQSALRAYKDTNVKEVEIQIGKWLKRAAERSKKEKNVK